MKSTTHPKSNWSSVAIFSLLFLLPFFNVNATTYTFTGTGDWTDANRWSPSYPGTTITFGNSVVVGTGANCYLNVSVEIEGALTNNGFIGISFNGGTIRLRANYDGSITNNSEIGVYANGELKNERQLTNSANATILVYGSGLLSNSSFGNEFSNYGTITTNANSTVNNHGNWNNYNGSIINNTGTFCHQYIQANFDVKAGGTFNNQSGGQLSVLNSASLFRIYGTFNNNAGATILNQKNFEVMAGGTLHNVGAYAATSDGFLSNYGTVNSDAYMNIEGGVVTQAGGVWNGTNTLQYGIYYLFGTLNTGGTNIGTLDISFSSSTALDVRSGGVVEIQLAGTGGAGASNGHDKVQVTGYVAWQNVGTGVINVTFANGFIPNLGDAFAVFSWSSYSGTPVINTPAGYTLTPNFSGTGLTLTVAEIPCNGTPNPGNTTSTVASPICPNISFTLAMQYNLTGVTRQWQQSTDGSSYTDISGATASTHVVSSISNTTWYRCNVTCTSSGQSAYSTPFQMQYLGLCYCSAGANNSNFEKISNVSFSTINNGSSSTAGYENFRHISTNVDLGGAYLFTATISNYYFGDQILVWVDFNQDGDFGDAGENAFVSGTGNSPTRSGIFSIPGSALPGTTTMRVRLHDSTSGANFTPCGNSTFGQVEDYSIYVVVASGPNKFWIGGTGNWDVATNWNPNGVPTSTDEVTLNAGALTIPAAFNAEAKFIILNNGADLTLATGASLTIQGGTGSGISLMNVNSSFENSGTVSIGNTGTHLIGGTGGVFSNNSGGTLKGTGSIVANYFSNNGGAIAPGYSPGIMTFDAGENFSNGTLTIEVNGTTTPGTNYDQIEVLGTATLGGTLNVTVNYSPSNNDQITILNATAITGTFSTANLPSGWFVNYVTATGDVVLSYGAALPVELVFFSGKALDHANLLQWQTATESNTERHFVERSADGRAFEEIGSLAGAGNSIALRRYEMSDKNPLPLAYYRLKIKDFDGAVTYSSIINLENDRAGGGDKMHLFPNPVANGQLTVTLPVTTDDLVTFRLFDAVGRLVFEQNAVGSRVSLDLEGLPSGSYFLSVASGGAVWKEVLAVP